MAEDLTDDLPEETSPKNTDRSTFEQVYARLQEVVIKMERGDLGMEATIAHPTKRSPSCGAR